MADENVNLPSLEGTLTEEREIPNMGNASSLKSLLRATSTMAQEKARPTLEKELQGYRDAGLTLADPRVISQAIENNTLSRRAVFRDINNGILDMLTVREKANEKQEQNNKWTFELMMNEGISPDTLGEDIISGVNSSLGWKPGTAHKLLTASHRKKALERETDRLIKEKLSRELGENMVETMDGESVGFSTKLDGIEYVKTHTGYLELYQDGTAAEITLNKEEGTATRKYLGYSGRSDDGFEVVFGNDGTAWNENKNNPNQKYPLSSNVNRTAWEDQFSPISTSPSGDPRRSFKNFTDERTGEVFSGECGHYYRYGTGNDPIGNELEAKKEKITHDNPDEVRVGFGVVMDVGTWSGHVALVEESFIDDKGKRFFNITDANWDGKGGLRFGVTLAADDPRIAGYIEPTNLHPNFKNGSDIGDGFTYDVDFGDEDDVSPSLSLLSPLDRLKAKALSVEIFKTRAGTKAENIESVAALMAAGRTVDEIKDTLRFASQSEEFTGKYRDAGEAVAFHISRVGSEATATRFEDTFDRHLENGDTDKALEFLRDSALVGVPTEEQRKIKGKDRTLSFVMEINQDLAFLEENGIPTNIFNGTKEQINGMVGKVREPEMRKVAQKVAQAVINYRRDMSGVAFSVPEGKEYKKIFPDIDKTMEYNEASFQALSETMVGDLDAFFSNIMGEGVYRELYGDAGASRAGASLDLRQRAANLGYNYDSMVNAGHSDEEIQEAIEEEEDARTWEQGESIL